MKIQADVALPDNRIYILIGAICIGIVCAVFSQAGDDDVPTPTPAVSTSPSAS